MYYLYTIKQHQILTIMKKSKTIKQLLKENEVETIMDYFELINQSFVNGQKKQAKDYFDELPRKFQEEYLMDDDSRLTMKQVLFLTL